MNRSTYRTVNIVSLARRFARRSSIPSIAIAIAIRASRASRARVEPRLSPRATRTVFATRIPRARASPRLAVARTHLRSSRRRPRSTVLERRRRLNRRASSRRTQHGRVAKITKNTPSSKAVRWTRDEARSRRQVTRRARIK
jgi:hypothetical protein